MSVRLVWIPQKSYRILVSGASAMLPEGFPTVGPFRTHVQTFLSTLPSLSWNSRSQFWLMKPIPSYQGPWNDCQPLKHWPWTKMTPIFWVRADNWHYQCSQGASCCICRGAAVEHGSWLYCTARRQTLRADINNPKVAPHKVFFCLRLIIIANTRNKQCLTRATTIPNGDDLPITSQ